MKNVVKLVEVDEHNWYKCVELELDEKQKTFLESNAVTIAQSKFEPSLRVMAIFSGDDVVGMLAFNTEKEELDSYWIYRIMIDKKYQGKGLGRAATLMMIDLMKALPECQSIAVGYHTTNEGAHKLYKSLGFIDRGDRFGKEMAVVLECR